jgi:hypothetical protein
MDSACERIMTLGAAESPSVLNLIRDQAVRPSRLLCAQSDTLPILCNGFAHFPSACKASG